MMFYRPSDPSCRFPAIIALLILLAAAAGCNYVGFYTRQSTWRTVFERHPRLSVLQRFAPQDSLLVSGRIVKPGPQQEPLLITAVSSRYRENEIVAYTRIQAPFNEYTLFLPAEDYGLFVFADLNGNGLFERNELVGQASLVVEPAGGGRDGIVEGPKIALDYKDPGKTVFRLRVRVQDESYVYPSLDDDFFDPRFGREGLYNPGRLMAHTQGFLFGLEDYNDRKTMVLFVHGIGGTPRDWKFFAEGLDRTRFQPFFLYYPSGMPLDKLGSLLAQIIESLDKSSRAGRLRIVLAAHSMGGLVALSAVHKLAGEGILSPLVMYCSFSTPYGGDEAARKGVETAPVVVPVWRDIAAGSEFLQRIHERPFPPSLPFHLFFTFNDPSTFKLGESSDGAVTLRSQLVPSVQASAVKVYGFNENHESFLGSPAARGSFLRLLDTVTPPATAGGSGIVKVLQ
jgi:pimeloyl-ACP methyl ester carboxylesterase